MLFAFYSLDLGFIINLIIINSPLSFKLKMIVVLLIGYKYSTFKLPLKSNKHPLTILETNFVSNFEIFYFNDNDSIITFQIFI